MKNFCRLILGTCLIWVGASVVYGQERFRQSPVLPSDFNLNQVSRNLDLLDSKPGHVYSILTTGEGKTQIKETNLMEGLDVIVEFNEEPWFIRRNRFPVRISAASAYQDLFVRFQADLERIQQKLSNRLAATLAQPQIKRTYYKVFFGASLTIPRAALSLIRNLDYVKKIHFDKKVEATLAESVPLIQADKVWSQLGIQGEGIVVGIIDTGVDYRHPALGGGLGPGFKVIGGYDFVNNDNDPLDDNGHGTHVAGIVAANSADLKGVAPNAFLMAFKVLGSGGSGSESNVIAGIERAVDPNDDGDTSDKVDVVNMSLGGVGHPEDAQSTAVDNAVALGMVFCIAAGNSGEFNTIGSPGTARLAITVGASDKADKLAGFSSKGPNGKIYSIKPEVVAPGVNINSAALITGTVRLNGTSMATPHVAGACALLKALHPHWNPLQIKSALMSTAIDIGEEVMAQGAGRIDALKAAQADIFTFPAHLSFGLADISQTTWTVSQPIKIVNQSSSMQNAVISFDRPQPGISLNALPAKFNLSASDSQVVLVTLNVDNMVVPFPEGGSLAYSGFVHINTQEDSLRIPWAFAKASKVLLTSDKPITAFLIADTNRVAGLDDASMFDPSTYEIALPKGMYDLVVQLEDLESGPAFIVKENLAIAGQVNISANATDAVHALKWNGVDENGRSLASLSNSQLALNIILPGTFLRPSSFNFAYEALQPSNLLKIMHVSDVTDRILLWATELQHESDNENIVRVLHYAPVRGVNSDLTVGNKPADFLMENLHVQIPPSIERGEISFSAHRLLRSPRVVSVFLGLPFASFTVDADSWRGKLYLTPERLPGFTYSPRLRLVQFENPQETQGTNWLQSGGFSVVGDKVGGVDLFGQRQPEEIVLFAADDTMNFGKAPIYGSIRTLNSRNLIAGLVEFYGSLNEIRNKDILSSYYKVFDGQNQLIAADTLYNRAVELNVAPGQYRMEVVNTNYFVGSVQGRAGLTSSFKLDSRRPDPPYITSLVLFNKDNKPVENLRRTELADPFGNPPVLQLIAERTNAGFADPNITRPIRLYYKKYGTLAWKEITHSTSKFFGGRSRFQIKFFLSSSDLPNMDSSAIDLRITMDGEELLSASELTLEPAFNIGNFGQVVGVEQPVGQENILPKRFALYPNYPNPFSQIPRFAGNPTTIIGFDLPKTTIVSLKIFDVFGREVRTLVDDLLTPGTHRIGWDGTTKQGFPVTSGVYFVQMIAGNFTATKKMLFVK